MQSVVVDKWGVFIVTIRSFKLWRLTCACASYFPSTMGKKMGQTVGDHKLFYRICKIQ